MALLLVLAHSFAAGSWKIDFAAGTHTPKPRVRRSISRRAPNIMNMPAVDPLPGGFGCMHDLRSVDIMRRGTWRRVDGAFLGASGSELCAFKTGALQGTGKFTCEKSFHSSAHPGKERWEFDVTPSCRVHGQEALYSSRMKNQTLWLLGDSLMQQLATTIACKLHSEPVQSPLSGAVHSCYRTAEHSRVCVADLMHFALKSSSKSASARGAARGGTSACSLDRNFRLVFGTADEPGLASPHDVVLLSFGLHYVPLHLEEGATKLAAMLECLASLRAARPPYGHRALPWTLWRESPAQHFPTRNGNWMAAFHPGTAKAWPKAPDPMRPCNRTIGRDASEADANRLNRRFEPLLAQAGLPVLRLWSATAMRGDDHVGVWRASRSGGYDCTHTCEPSSSLNLQADILLAFVSAGMSAVR